MPNAVPPTESDGRHDFDFLFGRWKIPNRVLSDQADPHCHTWLEFESTAAARSLLGGLGNTDSYVMRLPDGRQREGMTLRLFDPKPRLWRIWWASTSRPGHLDPPMAGRFNGPHGQFHGEDTVAGRAVLVRFDWWNDSPTTARWIQAFSFDQGETWHDNWAMNFTRARP
jgi:hypothetical protein